MNLTTQINFPPFCLDTANERLWRGSDIVGLRPKAFRLLRHLLEKPGLLHTKDDLLDACWPETTVTDTVLKVCIREIREALGDDPQTPRFIETAHRRGYRFIGHIGGRGGEPKPPAAGFRRADTERLSLAHRMDFISSPLEGLVGRTGALAQLRGRLKRASLGERQLIFVTGEAGIGKTTLVEAFLQSVAVETRALIARGQCLEHCGTSEAYLPVLEAFSRLSREARGVEVAETLRRYDPTWSRQLPCLSCLAGPDGSMVATEEGKDSGSPQTRPQTSMMREMAEAVEELTARQLFVLVLEDLHWSDAATVDLLSALARRRGAARLMIIATYRPVDLTLGAHPLKAVRQELEAHNLCKELPLDCLGEDAISALLKSRFAPHDFPAELPHFLQKRTGGNPLFLTSTLDYLTTQQLIDEREGRWQLACQLSGLDLEVSGSIRELIEKQLAELTDGQQRALEAASVAGMEFSATAVAALLGQDTPEVEAACDALARLHHFLRPLEAGRLSDGTVSARYSFVHALHQNVLLHRLTPARRARWQQLL